MVGKTSKKRLVTVVARRKIIPLVPMDINREYLFLEQNVFLIIFRRYLDICPIKVHETLPNGRQDIEKKYSTGRCTQKNYPRVPMDVTLRPSFFIFFSYFPPCHRLYLEICSMKVHETLPNHRQYICNEVCIGRCT